ncbi:MAG: hypothetical protein AAF501_04290, partial [Pseudomonadota bacterium]
MDGNFARQTQKLAEKAQIFADLMRTGRLSPTEAHIALNSTIMKTLEYPMEAISLTKKQWDGIMKPMRHAILPKMTVQARYPKGAIFA